MDSFDTSRAHHLHTAYASTVKSAKHGCRQSSIEAAVMNSLNASHKRCPRKRHRTGCSRGKWHYVIFLDLYTAGYCQWCLHFHRQCRNSSAVLGTQAPLAPQLALLLVWSLWLRCKHGHHIIMAEWQCSLACTRDCLLLWPVFADMYPWLLAALANVTEKVTKGGGGEGEWRV